MSYQLTRSIGFHLLGEETQALAPAHQFLDTNQILQNLESQYDILIQDFMNFVFYSDREGRQKVKSKLEVKSQWIKQYAKSEYYGKDFTKKRNKRREETEKKSRESEYGRKYTASKLYTIRDAEFFQEIFEEWYEKSLLHFEEVTQIIHQPKQSKGRDSDLNLLLKQLWNPEYFPFVRDLSWYVNDKNSTGELQKFTHSVEKFQTFLEQALATLSPNEATGMEVARASFNFYTVDKSSKLFDGKTREVMIEEKEKKQNTPYPQKHVFVQNQSFLQKIGFEAYLKAWEGKDGEKYSAQTAQGISFQELYSALKDFRSNQKSTFMEAITGEKWNEDMLESEEKLAPTQGKADLGKVEKNKKMSLDDFFSQAGVEKLPPVPQKGVSDEEKKKLLKKYVQENFPLFDASEDMLWKFVQITEEIKALSEEKNHAKEQKNKPEETRLSELIRVTKIKRGEFFIKPYGFTQYSKSYCNDIYKKVAMDLGKIQAAIRGLKQEQIDARLLNYWANILIQGERRFLVLIPKDTMRKAKDFLSGKPSGEHQNTVISFNSFTLRALDKLIRKNYEKEISDSHGNIPFATDQEKIVVYQKALAGKMSRLDLDLSGYEKEIEIITRKRYTTLEDFRLDFEKGAYTLEKKMVTESDIEKMKREYGMIISEISSYDLERNISHEKAHTSLWRDFWSEENQKHHFSTRLNPEIKIFYRKALEQVDPEGKKQNNRFSKEHFGVNFTLTENAATKELTTGFTEQKDLRSKIEVFNTEIIEQDFIKQAGENLYYFGIDRGNQELATLGVVQWTQEEYEATLANGMIQKFPKPAFPEIEVWKIKDPKEEKSIQIDSKQTHITVKISDNPSYFMNDDEEIEKYFEKKTVAFIDLTTAKLIKGKIILDGDTKTYLNLKKANAKRKLFEIFSKIDERVNVEFFENQFRIALKTTERNDFQTLCYFLNSQEKILSKTEMQDILQEYLEKLREDARFQETTIEQINHLRDAITANMVGIIAFLHEKYPAIINLENLHKESDIQRLFSSNNENIARRLEWALYRKFQKKGLVPPNLKQTIFLREEENPINHFGIIHFIPTENTSGQCPYCGENVSMNKREKDKFTEHAYICRNNPSCGFSTKDPKNPLESIRNSDDVAAYNIAQILPKKIAENKNSPTIQKEKSPYRGNFSGQKSRR